MCDDKYFFTFSITSNRLLMVNIHMRIGNFISRALRHTDIPYTRLKSDEGIVEKYFIRFILNKSFYNKHVQRSNPNVVFRTRRLAFREDAFTLQRY